MNTEEIWVPVKNYEGLYEVSSLGRIKSLKRMVYREAWGKPYEIKERILAQCDCLKYNTIRISKNGKVKTHYIHRLVLESFVDNINNLPEICHNDGNSRNNRVENLRWDTHYNNVQDMIKHGTTPKGKKIPSLTGSKNPAAKLKECEVSLIKKLLKNKIRVVLIAKMFKVEKSTIKNIKRGKNWKNVE